MITRDELAVRLQQPMQRSFWEERRTPPDEMATPAAVLVPLIERPKGVSVLLTQRAAHLRNHPNQISFPGGRVERSDRNRVETALRETEEEIGLLRRRVDVLGVLPDYQTPSGFRISPQVGWIHPPIRLKPDPIEVAAVFEVPLDYILDQANQEQHHLTLNGRTRHYLAFLYQGRYIWGATAAILHSLVRRIGSENEQAE